MSQCLQKIAHDECGSSDALQVFDKGDGTVDGFCFSCSTYVRHPYGDAKSAEDFPQPEEKSPEDIAKEIAFISGLPQVNIPSERLNQKAIEYYGVTVSLSEVDGKTPRILHYPYVSDDPEMKVKGYKNKIFPEKKIWAIGSLKNVKFFGWREATSVGARRVFITEGEDDCLALWMCIQLQSKDAYKDFSAVVSLPNGVSNAAKYIAAHLKELKDNFQEVILCFDTDAPGKKAVTEVIQACPEVLSVTVPGKDAKDCVKQGRSKALFNSLFKAARPKNSHLIKLVDYIDEALEPAKYGQLSWPFEKLNKATRGIRYGETIYIGAGVKMGKSDLLNALAVQFAVEENVPILLVKPEETRAETLKLLAGKMTGQIFVDPEIEYDPEFLRKTLMDPRCRNINSVDLYQLLGWEELKRDIMDSVINDGVKAVFIDPITNLTTGLDAATANVKLGQIAVELAAMAKDLDFVVFIFVHLNAHDGHLPEDKRQRYYDKGKFIGLGNCSHELGGTIYSNQFAGSRAMMRSCHLMIGIEGNKDADLRDINPVLINTRNIKILEARKKFTADADFPVYWNPKTHLFKEL